MMDRMKFAVELANELNKTHSQYLTAIMVENAVAAAVHGTVCGEQNRLADVVNRETGMQYSVKSYKDKAIPEIMEGTMDEHVSTGFIVERRVSGVRNPNGSAEDVFSDVFTDVIQNERLNFQHFGTDRTSVALVGNHQDEDYWYFRVTETDYFFDMPEKFEVKEFGVRSKNYMLYTANISAYVGYDSTGNAIYKWVHPNCSTYTRCLMKKYNLKDEDSFFFKIKKVKYLRPDINTLMSLIIV